MFAVFVITLFGCSEGLDDCDMIQQVQLPATTHQQCMIAAQEIMTTTRIDYPSAAANCSDEGVGGAVQFDVADSGETPYAYGSRR